MAVTVLGLAASACARVPSHFALPDLAMGDPAFGPTIEAYTATRVSGGNTVDVLLNGDQIFPAILDAIGSAQKTITYAHYFYEQGAMPQEIATANGLGGSVPGRDTGSRATGRLRRLRHAGRVSGDHDEGGLRGHHVPAAEPTALAQPLRSRKGQQP
jgi:hypothetical protein